MEMGLHKETQGMDWSAFETLAPCLLYGRNQLVYLQGDRSDRFYYLRSGRVKVFLISANGAEKVLAVREKGEIFGEAAFLDGMPRMSAARTMEKSELIPVTRQALAELVGRDPALGLRMMEFLARTVRMLSSQVDAMAFLQADKRLGWLLLRLGRPAQSGELLVRCTQEELGSLAGISRVTASRVLRQFSRLGWVETRYSAVVLRHPEALKAFLNRTEP